MNFLYLILLLMLLTPNPANAQAYLVGGAGISHTPHIDKDNFWYQDAFPHSFHETDVAWRLGVGYRLNSRFALEASWRDLGAIQGHAQYVNDSQYDAINHRVVGTPITADLWTDGSSSGPSASILAYAKPWLFGRVGVYASYYQWTVTHSNPGFAGIRSETSRGTKVSAFYGIGLESGSWQAEYNYFPNVTGAHGEPYPGFDKIETLTVAYKWRF